jgi:hypothetical protein
LNDQTVLSVEDTAYQSGGVWMGLTKLDDPNDEAEVAVVYRNLTVSAIEGAPDDRATTYQPSPP